MSHPYEDSRRSRSGVVAVIVRDERFLAICRSDAVVAPGMVCLPGGGIEGDESEEETLIREIREELGATVTPLRRVWRSVTPWNVKLAWWLAEINNGQPLTPDPAEVASIHWYSIPELRALPNLLESMHHFLDALEAGEIDLGREAET